MHPRISGCFLTFGQRGNLIFNIFDGVLASLYFQSIETSLVDGRELLLDGENNVLSTLEMCM